MASEHTRESSSFVGSVSVSARAPWRAPLFVFLFAMSVTTVLLAFVTRSERAADLAAFESEANRTTEVIRERVDTTITLLQGAAGLLAASQRVEPEEFSAYVRHLRLRERYPGILGVGYSERVPASDKDRRERDLQTAGLPGFRVWPVGARSEYHAIVYLEPMDERNAAAIGYDMHTDPVRREAMNRAWVEGGVAASGRVTLVQEIDSQRQSGFLIYIPVYRGGILPDTQEGRRRDLLGFVYAPLRVADLLQGVRGTGERKLDYELFDDSVPSSSSLLRSTHEPGIESGELRTVRTMTVGGREWRIDFAARPTSGSSRRDLVPWLAALCVATSALLAWIAWAQSKARQDAEASAEERRLGAVALQASEQRARERAELLQEAHAELRNADQRKDEFLAVLAHELRNPLAPIRSSLEILRLAPEGPVADRAREIMARQVQHMVRLIDDLLDVSRISRGKIKLQKQRIRVLDVVRTAVETSRPTIEARSHRLELCPVDPDIVLELDEARMVQVLTNLLNNAANYTPAGGEIRLSVESEADTVRISVRDTGIGIAADQLTHIFEMFRQLERSPAGGGLGIGLSLSARLVELHGGRIEARSEGPNQGSEFVIVLPSVSVAKAA